MEEREEDPERQAKLVRLILVTMAAGIVAAGFSLARGQGDSDVVAAAKATTEQADQGDDGIIDLIELAEPYELVDDNTHRSTITVGEARSLATIPTELRAITSAEPALHDDATIELSVDIEDGFMTRLSARVDGDDGARANSDYGSIVVDFEHTPTAG